ncbi:hypothetical protein D3C85_1005370 [compost metagenome]
MPELNGTRNQKLVGTFPPFFGKGAHGDGRDQEHEQIRNEAKKAVEFGIAVLQN